MSLICSYTLYYTLISEKVLVSLKVVQKPISKNLIYGFLHFIDIVNKSSSSLVNNLRL